MCEFSKVVYKVENQVARISMNCPENLNAMGEIMTADILHALEKAEADESVKCIVIESLGKAFCAGGDIRYMYDKVKSGENVSLETLATLVGNVALKIKTCPKIIITVVNGSAAGAGANMALGGDFVVCSEKAMFLQAFATLGLVPDTGGAFLLSRGLTPQQVMEYTVLDKPLKAAKAKELGLVNEVVPVEELEACVAKLTAKITSGPQRTFANIKRQLFEAQFKAYEDYLVNTEKVVVNECASTPDFKEGLCAFIEKRKAEFK